jgi:hypothetical protein
MALNLEHCSQACNEFTVFAELVADSSCACNNNNNNNTRLERSPVIGSFGVVKHSNKGNGLN